MISINRYRKNETRKQRREAKKYQPLLLALVNSYIEASNETKTPEILEHKYNALRNEWKFFVNKWNSNPKYKTELRDTDFDDLIKDLTNEEKK
jgi:hypothetical protein